MFYNLETMRCEIVGDKRPDLLYDKLEMDIDYGSDEPADDEDDLY